MEVGTDALAGRRVVLIVSGGIAAYKSLDLVRRLKDRGTRVACVLTGGGAKFVTPLSLAALSGQPVHEDLFSAEGDAPMAHIRLSRESELVVVAPASANLLARMASGLADDLASAVLLATNAPVLAAPAMNTRMWAHPATQRNIATLRRDGIAIVEPAEGDLACGETGPGRMVEPGVLLAAIAERLSPAEPSLSGLRALVTSGPTREAIDPVRYLANRSSGKQGHAVASALARRGAAVMLVSGPTAEPDPPGVTVRRAQSAREMLAACEAALPVDVAVCAAAVSDWRAAHSATAKLKKADGRRRLDLVENPDILAGLGRPGPARPRLVVGFAAETEPDAARLIALARDKRSRKGCDWVLANDVSAATGILGGDRTTVHLVTETDAESWPTQTKAAAAERLADRVAGALAARASAA